MSTGPPHAVQILSVWHREDTHGNERLVYAPGRLTRDEEEAPPEPTDHPVKWPALEVLLAAVRNRVEELIALALLGRKRENIGLEHASAELSAHILPQAGFADLIAPDTHPHFDIMLDRASMIPWEVVQERYYRCPNPGHRKPVVVPARRAKIHPPHCPEDGQVMQESGGWLALDRHLSHLVRGGAAVHSVGREFLLIFDPTRDLCQAKVDPEGRCAGHKTELYDLLSAQGYDVTLIPEANATVERVKSAIARRGVVGMYFFGHGCFPENGDQGFLQLANGPLYAQQVEEINPGIRFVFLNACQGADVGRKWDLEKKYRSMGHAFARGGPAKVVIAPLWPVINRQAATTALEFFRLAFSAPSLAEALRKARHESYDRYQKGEPDISWVAYRYFGSPNRTMPLPQDEKPAETASVPAQVPAAVARPLAPRLFDAQGKLRARLCGFPLGGVLDRAMKRRRLHGRRLISSADFLAGLVRKGNLTRYVLWQCGADPDKAYMGLLERHEKPVEEDSAPSDATWKEALTRFVQHGLLPGRDQFQADLLSILERADLETQSRLGREALVTERDVLRAFAALGAWPSAAAGILPALDVVRGNLEPPDVMGITELPRIEVDDNGLLPLERLDAGARRALDVAHALAQQRGQRDIGYRLLAGAFLVDPRGDVSRLVQEHGVAAPLLGNLLIASTEDEKPRAAETFDLSAEVGRRVVLPALGRARALAGKEGAISESLFFQAFCQTAQKALKPALLELPWPLHLDLEVFAEDVGSGAAADRNVCPTALAPLRGQVDDGLWQTLLMAARIARLQASAEIRNPHLGAALLRAEDAGFREALLKQKKSPEEVRKKLLETLPAPKGVSIPRAKVRMGENAHKVFSRAVRRAQNAGRAGAGNADLLEALLADTDNIVAIVLRKLDVELPLV